MAEPTTNHTMRAASRAWIGASGVAARGGSGTKRETRRW